MEIGSLSLGRLINESWERHNKMVTALFNECDTLKQQIEKNARNNSAKFDKMIELLSKIAGEPVKDDIPPPEEEYEIANCSFSHKGPWKGTWGNCKIIKKNDDGTFNVKLIPRDINYCLNVPGHFIRKTNDQELMGEMPHYKGMLSLIHI